MKFNFMKTFSEHGSTVKAVLFVIVLYAVIALITYLVW